MRNPEKMLTIILLAMGIMSQAAAQEVEEAKGTQGTQEVASARSWKGESELGLVLTEGNTETSSINGKLKVEQSLSQWRNTYQLDVFTASENEEVSAEKYSFSTKADRVVSDQNFLFGLLTYEDDRFSGFDYESSFLLGYGRKLLDTSKTRLELEVGPGVRFSRAEGETTEDEAILRSAGLYQYHMSEHAYFEQKLSVDGGDERVVTKSVSALVSQLVGGLAMKLSLSVKHNSEPADASKKSTDSETSVTLVYGF